MGHDKAQNIIDQITSAYESSGGPPPGGFGFGPQHLGGPPPGYGGPPMGFGGPMPPPGFGGRAYSDSYTLMLLIQNIHSASSIPPRPRIPSHDASRWAPIPPWWNAASWNGSARWIPRWYVPSNLFLPSASDSEFNRSSPIPSRWWASWSRHSSLPTQRHWTSRRLSARGLRWPSAFTRISTESRWLAASAR